MSLAGEAPSPGTPWVADFHSAHRLHSFTASRSSLMDFSERVKDPAERERRIRTAVEAYVARLESLCRAHPYNWFNFHDFWLEDTH